jgi:tetratricopeptide (TPR) repeat protein
VTRLDPTNVDGWKYLGNSWGELGQYARAVEALREAVRLHPNSVDSWHLLGFALTYLGHPREGIEALREALRLEPNCAEAWFGLGIAHGDCGEDAESLFAYRESVRLKPGWSAARQNLGVMARRLGEHVEATRPNQREFYLHEPSRGRTPLSPRWRGKGADMLKAIGWASLAVVAWYGAMRSFAGMESEHLGLWRGPLMLVSWALALLCMLSAVMAKGCFEDWWIKRYGPPFPTPRMERMGKYLIVAFLLSIPLGALYFAYLVWIGR